MIPGEAIDVGCAALLSFGVGMLVGAHWTRREWIAACRKRKLIRNDANSGKLVWRDGGGDVP